MATNQQPAISRHRSYRYHNNGHGPQLAVLPGYSWNEGCRRERKLRQRTGTFKPRLRIEGAYQRAPRPIRPWSRISRVSDAVRWPAHASQYACKRSVALADNDHG